MTRKVAIWTDGACSGNPGPGGWGAILTFNGVEKELSGGEPATTNNHGADGGHFGAGGPVPPLRRRGPYGFAICSPGRDRLDAQLEAQWLAHRRQQAVKNEELWKRLDEATLRHDIEWFWVKGHAGDPMNERADALARKGMAPFQKTGRLEGLTKMQSIAGLFGFFDFAAFRCKPASPFSHAAPTLTCINSGACLDGMEFANP